MYYCEICNNLKDGDFTESYEYRDGIVCFEHVCENSDVLTEECNCKECEGDRQWKPIKKIELQN